MSEEWEGKSMREFKRVTAFPKPVAAKIDGTMDAHLRWIRYFIGIGMTGDGKGQGMGILLLDETIVRRFNALYEFDLVEGSAWKNMLVWTHSMLDQCLYVCWKSADREGETRGYYLVNIPLLEDAVGKERIQVSRMFNQEGQRVGTQVNMGTGTGMGKVSFTLSDKSFEQLGQLAEHFGVKLDVALKMAVDDFHRVCVRGEGQLGDHGE